MGSTATGTLDEAYERLHATGPEFDGWLSNHGPMAAEAMVRHGHAGQVHRWLDGYMARLEEFPRGSGPIGTGWQDALGDPRRIADWTAYFRREVSEQPWRQVLGTWWPRLLPGVAAAATHGVIRVGHAVRALTQDGEDAEHLAELAHGLAYWAARWQPVPGTRAAESLRTTTHTPARAGSAGPAGDAPTAGLTITDALAAVPRIADQTGGIRDRLGRLTELPGWTAALTAQTTLPGPPNGPQAAEEAFGRAVEHGDEHVIKFADTAADVFARTGNPSALAAAIRATHLIER